MIRQHFPGRPFVLLRSAASPTRTPFAPTSDSTLSSRDTWRLVLAVTVPFWAYMALMRVGVFLLITAGNPGIIIAAPHIRLLQHLLLLPLLVLFYRWALAIGWPSTGRWRAALKHAGMALLFSQIARPVLLVLVAGNQGNWALMRELVNSRFGVQFSIDLWVSTAFDFLLSYVLGLAILLGIKNYRELKYQKLRAVNLQAAFTQSRLQSLRMQLNPHFLFNTLNAIVVLVRQQKGRQAEETLGRFSDLLRAVLADMDAQEVTLARELEYLKLYLSIEQLRFSDRLRVDIDVDPELLDAAVPHMALQPIVENSIRHGVGQRATPGLIRIRAERIAEALHVRVQDDGPGFAAAGAGGGLKLGLANTRARLKQLYGDASELRTESGEAGGALVTMILPFHFVETGPVAP
jgi:two-component sensor histidine kinase